eukprot:TRINITY_DN40885_c0_g1_i2.p1 TRINITY_DN40885_c0_g1~~TRINITY_DN40885_c0_g1_i2.p1  ORF type:complete len:411 (-),score=75.29 TRINITY_DN40885_c0_g1_i2:77-1309(-)
MEAAGRNAAPFLWRCCGGEAFLHLPGLGLVHIPQSADALKVSHAFFMLIGFIVAIAALLAYLLSKAYGALFRRPSSRLLTLACSLPLATLLVPQLLQGSAGDALLNTYGAGGDSRWVRERQQQHQSLLEGWLELPTSAPFQFFKPRGSETPAAGVAQIALQPQGNLTIWSEARAAQIAERTVAVQQRWTASVGLSRGLGTFLLGFKYGGSLYNGEFVTYFNEETIEKLWSEFGDVFEDLRSWCQQAFGLKAHLYRENFWHPPTFITHMPSALFLHGSSMQPHQDAVLQEADRVEILSFLRLKPGWARCTCEWEAELSLLACLSLPSGGGGLRYWTANSSGIDIVLAENRVNHSVGKAILLEAMRPHTLSPFAPSNPDGLHPRTVVHAFLIPCTPSPGADPEILVLGPVPR